MVKEKQIVVNATALDRSGALSILCQFIENIPENRGRWLIFISDNISLTSYKNNVRIEPIGHVKQIHKRIWWDSVGLKKWLKKHKIEVEAAISLQNTGFNVGINVPTFIYYHQSIPFFPYSWNLLKRNERTFWFYKYIYPLSVKLFLKKDTEVFVQLDFIKDGFADYFRHPRELISVFSPTVLIPDVVSSNNEMNELDGGPLNLFYPATNHFYKNHRVIENALKLLQRDTRVYFTVERPDDASEENNICHTGLLPYGKVYEMYYKCDALLFPSYIETFGLPLLEAALTGIPIIAADLPYAREVLTGYEGVTFVPFDKPEDWANSINKLEKGKRYRPIDISNRPGWPGLFKKIFSKI